MPTRTELEAATEAVAGDHVIAIDGPAGSGKSTTARAIARRYGLTYVDTGAMYRALTLAARKADVAPEDAGSLVQLLADARLRLEPADPDTRVIWNGHDVSQAIRTPEIDATVSTVAAHRPVRRRMVERQRELARRGGVVMEGRDIGSVVLSLATTKIYLDGSLEARAERRWRQERERGRTIDRADVIRDLEARDRRDQEREEGPLVISPDALVLDTSPWSLERQLDEVALACRINPWLDARVDWDERAAWRAMPGKYRLVYNVFAFVAQMVGQRVVGRPAATVPPGVILASNHISWFDPPLVGGSFRRSPVRTIAKQELFSGTLATALFRWMDAIPINRRGYDADAFDAAREALRQGDNLFMFPEGTRRPPGLLGPVKGGLGILAQETRAPILPVFVRGTCALSFGGNPESPHEVRYGPIVRLHGLDALQARFDRKVVTKRIGDMALAILEELQARSYADRPLTDLERAVQVEARRRIRSKRPFARQD
ncbi:(d)CMP kinase [bacterium]|nr:(d)CMP kinase [bacterium]